VVGAGRPVWSSGRGGTGPLDRVAQIAERKCCRPHARPSSALASREKCPCFQLPACCALGPLACSASLRVQPAVPCSYVAVPTRKPRRANEGRSDDLRLVHDPSQR
jgi:hypothetical protein